MLDPKNVEPIKNGQDMKCIYVVGHRNPDMDSLCAASAYAYLKNCLDSENHYMAVRAGHMTPNAKSFFQGVSPQFVPKYLRDARVHVNMVMNESPVRLQATDSVKKLADIYRKANPPMVVPVFDGKKFVALLTLEEIAKWFLSTDMADHKFSCPVTDVISYEYPEIQDTATYDEGVEMLSNTAEPGVIVKNADGEFVGTIIRKNFLKKPRLKLVLVDHNEFGQAIAGIEEAEVVEILDHHRLDTGKTNSPIFILSEPVGSSCTIVSGLFGRWGVDMPSEVAKILLAGVLADTVNLQSPTTTTRDIRAVQKLTKLAGIDDLEGFKRSLVANIKPLKERDERETLLSDFKRYSEGGIEFGVGQCEVSRLDEMLAGGLAEEWVKGLEAFKAASGLAWVMLLVTDIIHCNSVLLSSTFHKRDSLAYKLIGDGIYDCPKVISRKKQLLPEVLRVIES